MKKLKKIILRILLYTICWRNVDKLYDIWAYDIYNVKLGKEGMKMAWGFILGLALGALTMNIAVEKERSNNEVLRDIIDDLNEDIDRANFKIECKDEKINDLQEEQVTLLKNASEARAKILDLENNLELVTNNLSLKNKKLIPDFDSQN